MYFRNRESVKVFHNNFSQLINGTETSERPIRKPENGGNLAGIGPRSGMCIINLHSSFCVYSGHLVQAIFFKPFVSNVAFNTEL